MRRMLLLIGCAALLLTGCGTAEVNFHTTLRDTGETNQEVTVTATGALAAALSDSIEIGGRQDGWDVEITEQRQATVLRAQKWFKPGEGLLPFVPDPEGAPVQQPLSIARENSFLFERCTLRVSLPRDQIAAASW